MSRVSMMVGFGASLALAGQLVACGSDDAPADGTTSSSGNATTSSSGGGNTSSGSLPDAGPPSGPTVTISDSRAKIYLGQKAVLDASVAPGSTAWTVVNAPFESTVTTASLEGATGATPSFTPDLLGSYTLQGTGGASTVLVFIEALDAPVFWRSLRLTQAQSGNADYTLATYVGGIHGAEPRVVGCADVLLDAGGGANNGATSLLLGSITADAWEGPAGTPSRFAFGDIQSPGDGTSRSGLRVATSTSTCASSAAEILTTVAADASPQGAPPFIGGVRFSPSGNRLAYAHDVQDQFGNAVVASIGFDGSAPRDLSVFFSDDDGGLVADAGPLAASGIGAPRWQDETHLGWIASQNPLGQPADAPLTPWNLFVTEDAAGAVPQLFMRCGPGRVTSYEFLPDGSVAVALRHEATDPVDGATTPMNVIVYKPNATTKTCEVVRNVTGHTKTETVTHGLSLSPDKTRIAFLDGIGSGAFSPTSSDAVLGVYWAPVDGSSAYAAVPGSNNAALSGGTRWAAGGTALTYSEPGAAAGTADVGRIVALPLGGAPRVLAMGSQSTTLDDAGQTVQIVEIVAGINQGCNASGELPFGTLALGSAVGVLGLVLRRKRST